MPFLLYQCIFPCLTRMNTDTFLNRKNKYLAVALRPMAVYGKHKLYQRIHRFIRHHHFN